MVLSAIILASINGQSDDVKNSTTMVNSYKSAIGLIILSFVIMLGAGVLIYLQFSSKRIKCNIGDAD